MDRLTTLLPSTPGSGNRRRMFRRNISGISSDTSDNHSNTAVYVKDAAYVWLPAQIQSSTNDEKVMVKIVLPDDWVKTTILHDKSSIQELEIPMTSGGFGKYNSPKFGMGKERNHSGIGSRSKSYSFSDDDGIGHTMGNNLMRKRKAYNYERNQLDYDESIPKGVMRTVLLKDYTNSEPPLQNTDRHAQRTLSRHRRGAQRNTIYHPLVNARDMADLHYLHEAAILYNLKLRHGNSLPYTRVGDIVVAVNPFEWIDGLYSSEKQALYAQHLIWDAKDYEVTQKEQEDEDGDIDGDDETMDQSEAKLIESFKNDDILSPISPPRLNAKLSTPRKDGVNSSSGKKERHEPMSHGSIYSRLRLEPHVYELASLAYRGLASNRQNQTILVSGESGAGKTETVKIVMSNLATVERTRPLYHPKGKTIFGKEEVNKVVKQVMDSNPVFEAFGCAKTVRNDNSSRFGRFTQLQYEVEGRREAQYNSREMLPNCLLVGSFCATYLLEKNRVVWHAHGERNYHIFYQLLSAPDREKKRIWDGLKGTTYDSFSYIGFSETSSIEGVSDKDNWHSTLKALKEFDFDGDSLLHLLRALCIVLQLGNLTFSPTASSEEGSHVSSPEELSKLSQLIGIPEDNIVKALTMRVNKIRGEEVVSKPNPKDAKDGCDALAKSIYACIFEKLVQQINEHTSVDERQASSSGGSIGTISLLDIFGFERFDTNRFEQLCINFSNERLQHRYVLDNFKAVKEEYTAEGIDIFDFGMVDNSSVLELLEGKLGLITSLNEECMRPQGNPSSFVYKLKMQHSGSEDLLIDKLQEQCEFGIKHFAGAVTYDANEFLKSNADLTPKDLLKCACESSNPFIREQFTALVTAESNANNGPRRRSRAKKTVMTKFRSQLNILMESIEETKTRYIRTIKPNGDRLPRKLNHRETMNQLESAGLVTAITISRETFPNRLPYDVILDRFQCLNKKYQIDTDQQSGLSEELLKSTVNQLLSSLLLKPFIRADGVRVQSFSCGRTKVYFRTGALEELESARMQFYSFYASKIQKWYRCRIARVKYVRKQRMIVFVQARARRFLQQKRFHTLRYSCIKIQSIQRMLVLTKSYAEMRRTTVKVQSVWRGIRQRKQFRVSIRSIVMTQKYIRGYIFRKSYHKALQSSIHIQAFWRGTKAREYALRLYQRRRAEDSMRRVRCAITIQRWLRKHNTQYPVESDDRGILVTPNPTKDRDGAFSSYYIDSNEEAASSLSAISFSGESSVQTEDVSVQGRGSVRESQNRHLEVINEFKAQITSLEKENGHLTVEVEKRQRHLDAVKRSQSSLEKANENLKIQVDADKRLETSLHQKIENMVRESELLGRERSNLDIELAKVIKREQSMKQVITNLREEKISFEISLKTLENVEGSLREELERALDDMDKLKFKLKHLEQEKTEMGKELDAKSADVDRLKPKVESLEIENDEMNTELETSYGEVNRTKARLESLEEENNEMNTELEASYGQVNNLNAQVGTLEDELKKLHEKVKDLISQIERLKNENAGLSTDLSRSNAEKFRQKSEILSLLQQIEDRDNTVQDFREKLARVSQAMEERISEISKLETVEEELKGAINILDKALDARNVEADEYKIQITSLHETLNTKNDEIKSYKAQVASLEQVKISRNAEVGDLHRRLSSLNETVESRDGKVKKLDARVATLQEVVEARDTEVAQLQSQIAMLHETIGARDNRVNDLEGGLLSVQQTLESRDEEVDALQSQIASLNETVENRDEEVRDLEVRLSSAEEEVTGLQSQVTVLNEAIENKENKVKDMEIGLSSALHTVETRGEEVNGLQSNVASLNEAINKRDTEITSLKEQSSSLQKAMAKSAAEVNQYQKETTDMKAELNKLQDNIASLNGSILTRDELIIDLKDQLFSFEEALNTSQKQVVSLREAVETGEGDLNDMKKEAISHTMLIGKKDEKISTLSNQLESQKDAILSFEEQVVEVKGKSAELEVTLKSRSDEISELQGRISSLNKAVEEREAEVCDLRVQIGIIEETLGERNAEATSLNEALNTKDNEIVTLKAQISSLEQVETAKDVELDSLNNLVSSLNETIGSRDGKVADLEGELSSIQVISETQNKELGDLRAGVASLNEAIAQKNTDIDDMKEEVASLQNSLAIGDNEINTLKETLDQGKSDFGELKNQHDSLEQSLLQRDDEIEKLQAYVATLKSEEKDMIAQLTSLKNEAESRGEELENFKQRTSSLEDSITVRDTELSTKNEEISRARELISLQEGKIAKLEEEKSSLSKTTSDRDEEVSNLNDQILMQSKKFSKNEELSLQQEHKMSELKKEISSLMEIIDKHGKELTTLNDQAVSEKTELTSKYKIEISNMRKEIDSLMETIGDREEEFMDLNHQVITQNENVILNDEKMNELKSEVARLRQINHASEEENNSLHIQLKSLNKTIKDRESDLSDLRKHLLALEESLRGREEEVSAAQYRNNSFQRSISELEKKINDRNMQISVLERKIEERDTLATQFEEQIISLQQKNGERTSESDEIKSKISALEHEVKVSNDKNATLEKRLEIRGVEMEKVKEHSKSLEKDVEVRRSQIEYLHADLNARHDEVSRCKNLLNDVQSELTSANEQRKILDLELESMKHQLRELEEEATEQRQRDNHLIGPGFDVAVERSPDYDEDEVISLREQLTIVRRENTMMQHDLDELERGRVQLMNQMQSLVTSGKSATNRSQALLLTNKTLLEKIHALKAENSQIRRDIQNREQPPTLSASSPKDVSSLMNDEKFGRLLQDKETEIYELKETLKHQIRERAHNTYMMENKTKAERESLLSEIHSLKKRLLELQGNSEDYKSKIIDVLQTSHSAREVETRKLRKEIKALKEELRRSQSTSSRTLTGHSRHIELLKQDLLQQQQTRQHQMVKVLEWVKLLHSNAKSSAQQKSLGRTNAAVTFKAGGKGGVQQQVLDRILSSMEELCNTDSENIKILRSGNVIPPIPNQLQVTTTMTTTTSAAQTSPPLLPQSTSSHQQAYSSSRFFSPPRFLPQSPIAPRTKDTFKR